MTTGTTPLPTMMAPSRVELVPKSLVEWDHWVCWVWASRDGQLTKIPVQPDRRAARSNDPSTWTSFDAALAATKRDPDLGIGFVLDKSTGIIGIDLDHCLDEYGQLKSWAIPIVERFADTYIEISPRGAGIKIFCRGNLDKFAVNTGTRKPYKDGQIEVYSHARFFTVTGRAFNGAPPEIEEHQRDIDWLMNQIGVPKPGGSKPAPGAPTGTPTPDSLDLSANEIQRLQAVLEAAQENDPKFRALFQGELCGFPSRNEADLSLCHHLAAMGLNRDQIDAAFRMSGRMRLKWDERHFADGRTYGEATVNKALMPIGQPAKAAINKPANPEDGDIDDEDDEAAETAAGDPLEFLRRTRAFRKLPIQSFRKLGLQQAQYQLILADGRVISLGSAAQVLTPRHVQAAIADATQRVIPNYTRDTWIKIAEAIFAAAGPGENIGVEQKDETLAWLSAYWQSRTITKFMSAEELLKALKDDYLAEGILIDEAGCAYISAQGLRRYIHINYGDRLSMKELGLRLRELGFMGGREGRIDVRDGKKIVTRRLWKSPRGFHPDGTVVSMSAPGNEVNPE